MPDKESRLPTTKSSSELFEQFVRPKLLKVRRPARYIGEEQGQIVKDWDAAAVRFAYCFPDLYEIGMSYHGREVLYQAVNAQPHMLCERTFLPDTDMQALMRAEGVPLWTLESKRSVREFDSLGFSFTYELAYPSALLALELAGIPLLSAERGDTNPIVIGGGQCMCNPEPIAPYMDVIVNGEGEETLLDILNSLLATKGQPREQRLLALMDIEGVYVPRFYEPQYGADGALLAIRPTREGLPLRIHRRYIEDFALRMPPLRPVQSYIEIPSDKVYLEVMRGCPQGCRFCQAGYITRPARARTVELLATAAKELIANTGYDEVSLMSLSTLDHPEVFRLIETVKAALPTNVGVALPSLRADRMSGELAVLMRRPRESSLTIAVEAGSDSMRRAIRKGVTEEDVIQTFDLLMAAGWHKFKLYFMQGFSGEPIEAMDDIAGLVGRILAMARERGHRRPRLTISVSVLVPKPHTPLQWQGMERPELSREKQRRLAGLLRRYGSSVVYKHHDAYESIAETLLSRGGREMAALVMAAYKRGQTLGDSFAWPAWVEAIEECGIDLEREVYADREYGSALPWDHISRGVGRKYLWREWEYYHSGDANPACHVECTSCGLGCAAPVFDPDSRAVPASLKDYFAQVAKTGEAEVRGLRPFSPVYPEELAGVAAASLTGSTVGTSGEPSTDAAPAKPRVNVQRRS